jgi:hypothetical protein
MNLTLLGELMNSSKLLMRGALARWNTFASTGGVPDHSALLGLQGGTAGEYYHMTAVQIAAIHSAISLGTANGLSLAGQVLSLPTTASPTFAGLTVDTNTLFVDGTTHKIGMGTTTVPVGGLGSCTLAISGPNASGTNYPGIQITTVADAYPLFSILAYSHDNVQYRFDSYYDGVSGKEVSSSAISAFRLYKASNRLQINAHAASVQGEQFPTESWVNGISIWKSGKVRIGGNPGIEAVEALDVDGKIRALTAFNLNGTDGVTQAVGSPSSITTAGGIVTAVTVGGAPVFSGLTIDSPTLFVDSGNHRVGFGTTTIPVGGVGLCQVAFHGDTGNAGPWVQWTNTADNYPLLQIVPYAHNNIQVWFDGYFDGTNARTSGTTGTIRIRKASPFCIEYADAASAGAVITFTTGAAMDLTGKWGFGPNNLTPLEVVHSNANIRADGGIASTPTAVTVANAATTFAVASNVVKVTGDAGGNTVATITGGLSGQVLTLIFVDTKVTITDNASKTANTVNLSGAFTSAVNTTLTLVFDGTSWYEVFRSVNG